MSNFSASIPAANMQAANAELEELGHGPNNFSVPAYDGPSPAVALLHAWGDPVVRGGGGGDCQVSRSRREQTR